MAVDSNDPTTGRPIFLDTGAPDTGVDPTAVGIYAAEVGNRIVKANLAELDAYPYKRAGLEGHALDTHFNYVHDGSGWVLKDAGLVGRVVRSGTATTFPNVYTNVATNSFWSAEAVAGFAAYNDGWTIPVTGRYLVSYEFRATASFLSGVSVNYAGPTPALFLAASPPAVQGLAAATVAATKKFTAGDVIRPYLLAASGSPSWVASVGFFSVEWIGVD